MKRIVVFVEGQSDADAVPNLARRLLGTLNEDNQLFIDSKSFRIGNVTGLVKDNWKKWKSYVHLAQKRTNLHAILVVLDGDLSKLQGSSFCAATVAKEMTKAASDAGGGVLCSIAVVFARQEFESWLIAGIESLAGKSLADQARVKSGTLPPATDLELAPRGAKEWLNDVMEPGYKQIIHQAELAKQVDLDCIRRRGMRSFARLEHAIEQIVEALKTSQHMLSPL